MVGQLLQSNHALAFNQQLPEKALKVLVSMHYGRSCPDVRQQRRSGCGGMQLLAKSHARGISRRHVKVQATQNSNYEHQKQNRWFQGIVAQLKQLSYQELQQLCEDESPEGQAAFSASFLFWLSNQEKQAAGPEKQELSNLAAQLVYIKEQADWEASRRMLPPLASSLAYSNYSTWQAQHDGEQLPEVAPGVSITELYKAAEREEAKLKQWQSPQRQASTLDSFAASSGYKQMAADAMARVRARLSGWADDETLVPSSSSSTTNSSSSSLDATSCRGSNSSSLNPAADKVLQQLLLGCCCREERATLLPEAFMPPGLEVAVDGSSDGLIKVVTTPQRLLAVIDHQTQLLEQQQKKSAIQSPPQQLLPSGEVLQQVLLELQEDITEYDAHVYSKLSKRDMYGRF